MLVIELVKKPHGADDWVSTPGVKAISAWAMTVIFKACPELLAHLVVCPSKLLPKVFGGRAIMSLFDSVTSVRAEEVRI